MLELAQKILGKDFEREFEKWKKENCPQVIGGSGVGDCNSCPYPVCKEFFKKTIKNKEENSMCCQNYETLKTALLALLKWSDEEIRYHLTEEGFRVLQKHEGYEPSYKKDIIKIKTALNIIRKEV